MASNGWVNNLMRRNGFLLHHKTTTTQQDPEQLIDKLILYLSIKCKYPPSSIIAMDKTPVSNGMVSNFT